MVFKTHAPVELVPWSDARAGKVTRTREGFRGWGGGDQGVLLGVLVVASCREGNYEGD